MSSCQEKNPFGGWGGRGVPGSIGLMIAITAPWGSAMTLKRPTVGMSIGGTTVLAPSDSATD